MQKIKKTLANGEIKIYTYDNNEYMKNYMKNKRRLEQLLRIGLIKKKIYENKNP